MNRVLTMHCVKKQKFGQDIDNFCLNFVLFHLKASIEYYVTIFSVKKLV